MAGGYEDLLGFIADNGDEAGYDSAGEGDGGAGNASDAAGAE